jgi:hypothetical protein
MVQTRALLKAAVAAAVVFLLASAASAAVIHDIRFEQYTYEDVLTFDSTGPTDLGGCVVEFGAEPAAGYLNVAAFIPGLSTSPQWIVHNLRLHALDEGVPEETVTYQFPLSDLGVEDGMVIAAIEYGYEIMTDPMLDADAPAWLATVVLDQNAPVTPVTVDVGEDVPVTTGVIDEPTGDEVYHAVSADAGADTVKSNIGCEMPNIDLGGTGDGLDVNACMPASCGNSLEWLKNKHGDINFPHDKRSVMKQIARAAGRIPPAGVHAHDAARAKLDFIEAHKLPIHVKIQTASAHGDIKSTSGATTCEDKDAGAGSWPTRNFIMEEARKGEDVEVIVTYYYKDTDGKLKPANMAHALVLTGAGTKAGADYVKLKDDGDQHASGGTRQRESGIKDEGWGIELTNLKRKVPAGRPGAGKPARAFVSAVVSESRDTTVTHPGGSETASGYCQLIKRTVPKGGTITFAYPDTGSRCYNSTLILRQPGVTHHDVYLGPWNFNKGKSRSWTNTHDQPMVVMLHNDDKAPGQSPYPGFDVGISITDSTGAAVTKQADSPFNPEEYGGFSLGGNDFSSDEFAQVDLGALVTSSPIMEGFDLGTLPSRLATASPGTQELLINIPTFWNRYWEHLGFVVDVLTVNASGDLLVECPANGFSFPLPITASGRYELDLGTMPPVDPWELRLVAQNGLDIELDAIGVPSLVPHAPTDVPEAPPAVYLAAAPNPFNPRTSIKFGLARATEIDLSVYDVRGRRVATLATGLWPAGDHAIEWDGRDGAGHAVASGTYICRLEGGTILLSSRVTLVR